MAKKILKIVIDVIVSIVFFLLAAILLDWLGSKVFGTRVGEHGNKVVNVNGGVMIAITLAMTIVFAVWFYKFMTNYKIKRIKE